MRSNKRENEMQTEKEFKELAQSWINNMEDDVLNITENQREIVMDLMWHSYNQAIEDSKSQWGR